MSYVIEKGIPIPHKPRKLGRAIGVRSEVTIAVGALGVGESLVFSAATEAKAKSRVNYYGYNRTLPWASEQRRFTYASLNNGSYRIWRTA